MPTLIGDGIPGQIPYKKATVSKKIRKNTDIKDIHDKQKGTKINKCKNKPRLTLKKDEYI